MNMTIKDSINRHSNESTVKIQTEQRLLQYFSLVKLRRTTLSILHEFLPHDLYWMTTSYLYMLRDAQVEHYALGCSCDYWLAFDRHINLACPSIETRQVAGSFAASLKIIAERMFLKKTKWEMQSRKTIPGCMILCECLVWSYRLKEIRFKRTCLRGLPWSREDLKTVRLLKTLDLW